MDTNIESVPVLHIDRNRLFREGLRRILDDSFFVVVGEASTIEDGIDKIAVLNPKIIIVDPDGYNTDTLSELMANAGTLAIPPRVIVLTDNVGMSRLASALDAGIGGYLLKDMSTDALKQSLQLVLMGETVFPTNLACLLINNRFTPSPNGRPASRNGELSARETEILSCLVNGLSNKEIANQLDITEGTVKVHLKGILKKVGANNRTQAAIWAVQNDMVAEFTSETQGVKA